MSNAVSDVLLTKFLVSPDVAVSSVGDETVLLHLGSGIYFGLDELGTRVWKALQCFASVSQVCDGIAVEYDVPLEQVKKDIRLLLGELQSHDLIVETK